MTESKSVALPLGDIPMCCKTDFKPRQRRGLKKKNGVDEGIRTLGLQSHNLAR